MKDYFVKGGRCEELATIGWIIWNFGIMCVSQSNCLSVFQSRTSFISSYFIHNTNRINKVELSKDFFAIKIITNPKIAVNFLLFLIVIAKTQPANSKFQWSMRKVGNTIERSLTKNKKIIFTLPRLFSNQFCCCCCLSCLWGKSISRSQGCVGKIEFSHILHKNTIKNALIKIYFALPHALSDLCKPPRDIWGCWKWKIVSARVSTDNWTKPNRIKTHDDP